MEKFNVPFEEYKRIDAINYSLLKRVADSGHLYNVGADRDKPSFAMDLGSLIEQLTMPDGDPDDLSMYYFLATEPPTAMTLQLADLVIKYCKDNNISFYDLKDIDEKEDFIFKLIKENGLWSNIVKENLLRTKYVDNNEFYNYIGAKLAIDSGKKIVAPSDWEKANTLANILKTHKYTKDIVSKGLNQVTYTFDINGVKYKIRLDKLIIDAEKQVLKPYDLKTGAPAAHQFEKNFWMFRYYLQQALYILGVHHMAEKHFPGYTVEPFRFIYISTEEINPYPVIWEMSEKWADYGYNGFISRNREIKGIKQLVEELRFYEKHGHSIPKDVYENGGVIQMELPN